MALHFLSSRLLHAALSMRAKQQVQVGHTIVLSMNGNLSLPMNFQPQCMAHPQPFAQKPIALIKG